MAKTTDKALLEALKKVPLFGQCTAKELQTIAASGKVVKRKAGAEIVREGRNGSAFFLLLDGKVEITRDGQPVARLIPGDFFGELALLSDHRRNADAHAVDDVELFGITVWSFRSILLDNPKIAYTMLQTIARRAAEN